MEQLKRIHLFFWLVAGFCYPLFGQETFPVNGVHTSNDILYAFEEAKIYVSYDKIIDRGTLLVRNGVIVEVGDGVEIPKDAIRISLAGKTIYPSFIDVFTNYGQPEAKKAPRERAPNMESSKKGAFYWNEAIHPETDAVQQFTVDEKEAVKKRKQGFGSVLSVYDNGISSGVSALVSLGHGRENEVILAGHVASHYSFHKGSSTQDYPSSLMGSIALLRQAYLDADWYGREQSHQEINLSLEAWNQLDGLPSIFDAGDKLTVLRADKVGDEFGVQYILLSGGNGYQRIDEMKATNAQFIIPINFPDAYDVEDPWDARKVSLAKMKHWEMAPSNPAVFEKNSIDFAITSTGLDDNKVFWTNLRKAIAHGLSESQALKSLTYTPANMIDKYDLVGSLSKGKVANFLVVSGNIFDEENVIHENWIRGKKYIINPLDIHDVRGTHVLKLGADSLDLLISGKLGKYKTSIVFPEKDTVNAQLKVEGNIIVMSFKSGKDKTDIIRLTGTIENDQWIGSGKMPDGEWVEWTAKIVGLYELKNKGERKKEKVQTENIGPLFYPNMAYGWEEMPKEQTLLVKNATVWTNEKEGVVEGFDVLIQNGKISAVGKITAYPSDATVMDATGLHLTPGIIDEHSHIAISGGVNESGQAVSAEVSISDVINSDNIHIYRQLAGGVTSAQLLHGSANPIGGQSGLIKFRWGSTPEEMKINTNDGFIKFALGETELETDRRIIRDKISRLKEKLKKIDKQKVTQRKNRSQLIRVALVGYTNVGKSTLMNLISKSDVFAENKLFATLDTTIRKVTIGNLPFLLSDTVGFIRKLPHQLIESFKSTLDEVRESDVLMHIVDVAHPNFEEHLLTVNKTLQEIQALDKPTILVFNKIDLFRKQKGNEEQSPNSSLHNIKQSWMANHVNKEKENDFECLLISAGKKENIDGLKDTLYQIVKRLHVKRYPYNNLLY